MATPNSTPFIPPLNSPQASPGAVHPPVIPLSSTSSSHSQSHSRGNSGANTPAYGMSGGWGGYTPAGGYPMFGVGPGTPYTAAPFIPTFSPYTPSVGGAVLSPLPPQGSNGLSLDYAGYPNFGAATPFVGNAPLGGGGGGLPPVHPPVVPSLSQGTPWHPGGHHPLPPHHGGTGMGPGHGTGAPPGTPWLGPGGHSATAPGPGRGAGGYPPFGPPPLSAPPMYGGFPPGGGSGWPGAGMFTPGMGGEPGHLPGAGGWGMPMGMGGAASMGLGMGAVHPGVQPPGSARGPLMRGNANDRMPPWTVGKHYGPVLDPLHLKIVRAQLKVNPLIMPFSDDEQEGDYLKWSMLYATNNVQRSSDPDHISWSNGREEPATLPRLSQIKIVSKIYPWTIEVNARDPEMGVTCGEVIDAIGANLYKLSGKEDYEALSRSQQKIVGEAYRHNRSRAPGVPGGALGQGMRRMDFLGKMTSFGGVDVNADVVKEICGVMLPGYLVLKCQVRTVMTREELKAQEERDRAAARAASRATSLRSGHSGRPHGSRASSSVGIGVHGPSDDEYTGSDDSD